MFSLFIVVLSLCIVGILVYVHFALVQLPPNAKQLCDIWAIVEDQQINESNNDKKFLKKSHLIA